VISQRDIVHGLRLVLVVAVCTLTACAPLFSSPGVSTDTSDFAVEAHADTWRGRPIVAGYIHNKNSLRATRVQLRVEGLDAGGGVVGSGMRFLDRDIDPGDRVYFDVAPPVPAAAYRVTVQYVLWRTAAAGAGF
jgi:hypothetical protein